MRERAADVLEWLCREGEVDLGLLTKRVASGALGEGREITVGILHRLVAHDFERAQSIISSKAFPLLRTDPSFQVRYLVEKVLGEAWRPDVTMAPPIAEPAPPSHPVHWSFDASPLFGLQEGSGVRAAWWANELCKPLSPAEVRALSDIRRYAFDGPAPSRGHAFERESIFRALADVSGDSERTLALALQWNPMWPDSDLHLGWSPITPPLLRRIEEDELQEAFVLGDQTILHCFEMEPPKGDDPLITTEVAAVLVSQEYFMGNVDWENLWEPLEVHGGEATTLKSTILASIQEPAIVRYRPEMRIGGDFTPAFPSRRMVQMLGNEGFERVCWRDGRRWDLWGPGPALSRGTALLVRSVRLQLIHGYDLVWVVAQNSEPTYIVDPKRHRVLRRDYED